MDNEKVYSMSFAKIYPLLLNKVVRKSRFEDDVQEVIHWLTQHQRRLKRLMRD